MVQQTQQGNLTLLQKRERLRVNVEVSGEDVTPRNLTHPIYGIVEDRRTAFDQMNLGSSRNTSLYNIGNSARNSLNNQNARHSNVTISSFSSTCTIDEILQPINRVDSVVSTGKIEEPSDELLMQLQDRLPK